MNLIEKKLIKILVKKFKNSKINLKTKISEIPEWDSMNHFSIVLNINRLFKINLTLPESLNFKDIKDIHNIIKKKLSR
jgi:acyl carrier protein